MSSSLLSGKIQYNTCVMKICSKNVVKIQITDISNKNLLKNIVKVKVTNSFIENLFQKSNKNCAHDIYEEIDEVNMIIASEL